MDSIYLTAQENAIVARLRAEIKQVFDESFVEEEGLPPHLSAHVYELKRRILALQNTGLQRYNFNYPN